MPRSPEHSSARSTNCSPNPTLVSAIRAAYGALLNELAAIGVPRYRYEGPAEHVRRTLSTYPAPAESINELLHLFEIARFSEQPVTDADAVRARRVLTSTIDALADTVS